jgi:hypothetical protein
MARYCKICDSRVRKEINENLKKEYPYYCPKCDENMYEFETYINDRTELFFRHITYIEKGGSTHDCPAHLSQ